MAHLRNRHLIDNIKKMMKFSPIVGLIGHRQVGKTTLMGGVVKHYVTFDDEDIFIAVQKSAKAFLAGLPNGGVGLDECQLCESLFPALKERVRVNKSLGQYLLSGSVRFTSKKSIKESLTGRIMTFDLFPMTLSELHARPNPTFWKVALSATKIDENLFRSLDRTATQSQVTKYLETGGLPGVCFVRNEKARSQRLTSYLETILDRDVRKIVPTTLPFPHLLMLLRELAHTHGTPLNLSSIAKKTGISTQTIKKLLFAFEAVFLIRSIPLEGDYGHVIYFFEDIFELKHLTSGLASNEKKTIQLLYQEIRASLQYSDLDHEVRFFQYRTRSGVIVPIVLESNGYVLGVIPIDGNSPNRQEAAARDSLFKRYASSKVIFVSPTAKENVLNDRSAVVRLCHTT